MKEVFPGVSFYDCLYRNGFVVELPNVSAERVPKIYRQKLQNYGLRQLAPLRGGDHFICYEDQLAYSKDLARYFQGLGIQTVHEGNIHALDVASRLGISADVDLMKDKALLRQLKGKVGPQNIKWLSPYLFTECTDRLRDQLGIATKATVHSTEIINNKWVFYLLCKAEGLNVPPSFKPKTKEQALHYYQELVLLSRSHRQASGLVFGKLDRAASGLGVTQIQDVHEWLSRTDVEKALQSGDPQSGVTLSLGIKSHPKFRMPNVQIFVGDHLDEDLYLGGSFQILAKRYESDLEPTIHDGNRGSIDLDDPRFPKLKTTLARIAEILRRHMAYGISGIDLIVDPDGDFWILEDNNRSNGSTPACFVSRQYAPGKKWVYGNVATKSNLGLNRLVSVLESEKIDWRPELQQGVLLVNSACALFCDPAHSNVQILSMAEHEESAQVLFNGAREALRGLS